jgi:3-hydroxybutyryl-CoA dehydrogenase
VIARVGVAGAGTMGAGIAQLACLAGFETRLHDPSAGALERGLERLRADLGRGVARGRWSERAAAEAEARLISAPALDDLAGAELVIEAAPEDLELKRALIERLEEVCGPRAVLATNTSSLSVSEIATGAEHPGRICGMHFFNPPALMKLVEVVAGERSSEPALAMVERVAERMERTPVRCADSPGFIVNRCNRPFTLESLRMAAEGVASHAEIDSVVREDGFPMGPFELMDLIGIDVNLEVARSFFRQRAEPRWEPHPIQEQMVASGNLGRKTGRGFYEYGGDPVEPATPAAPPPHATRGAVLERLASALVNEACFAAGEGVASPADIDRAMRLGLNHPRGPFEWGRGLGPDRVLAILEALGARLGGEHYRPAPLLERWAAAGTPTPPEA